ncbi:hypothetical protein L345_12254, partial [Ophiophagus hannah]
MPLLNSHHAGCFLQRSTLLGQPKWLSWHHGSLHFTLQPSQDVRKFIGKLRDLYLVSYIVCSLQSFLFSPQGVFSDIQLVESGPGMARPGSQLNLVCKVTGFSIATSSSFAWNWIKQPSGKGIK